MKEPLVLSATQEVQLLEKSHRSGFRFTPLKIVAGVLMGKPGVTAAQVKALEAEIGLQQIKEYKTKQVMQDLIVH
ncbi:MAG: hypothetical protein ACREOI_38260 [bacterium]